MTFRLASFNLENYGAEPSPRAPALRQALTRLGADVLCLQEVNAARDDKDQPFKFLDALLVGTPYAGYHRAVTLSPRRNAPSDVHNIVTLSRWPILQSRSVRHDYVQPYELEGPDGARHSVQFERPLLYARIDAPLPRPLHVINLHWRAPIPSFIPDAKEDSWTWRDTRRYAEGCWISAQKQASQALETRLLIESLLDADLDAFIAVAGDFNVTAQGLALQSLQADVTDTGNPALAARSLRAAAASLPRARRFTVKHAGAGLMLDHIFMSQALARCFMRAEIRNRGLPDELLSFFLGRAPERSFHAPVLAEFDESRAA